MVTIQNTNGKKRISIVVAIDQNGLIGRDNDLPWYLPADLKHFKQITMGKPIIMGRKTHESIGKALPGRLNIVVSRDPDYEAKDVVVAGSVDKAIEAAGDVEEVMIIGGAALYERTLGRVDRIYLTRVHAELEGDTWFPTLNDAEWVVVDSVDGQPDERNVYGYTFQVLGRRD